MIVAILRTVGAVVAGLVVAFILIVATEMLSAVVHPPPAGYTGTPEEMCQYVERYPHWLLAVGTVLWGVAAFASTWTAGRLGNRGSALVVGLLLLTMVIFNISLLPYAVWFEIAILIVIPTAIVCGLWLSKRRRTSAADVSG
ncbi:MAG: hypothetical protein L0Y44_07500 [Phycisphaerales bacterium]|nr:hypothetical protein [Phycisphaerales bacterium]MCI0674228.1 hypothetical protein [Phycisphaerales bacterium]